MNKLGDLTKLTIETERLFLVATSEKHIKDIFENFTKEVTKYMFPKEAENISETENRVKSRLPKLQAGEDFQISIIDKETGEFLGCGGIHDITTKIPELGIRIKESAFGKKIGRETVKGLFDRANENLEFEYMIYPVDKDNIPSRKIAESLGGIVEVDEDGNEKVKIKETLDPNKKLNTVVYRIFRKN